MNLGRNILHIGFEYREKLTAQGRYTVYGCVHIIRRQSGDIALP